METSATKDKTLYSILFAVSFAHLLNDMMQSVIPSIYPLIKDEYGFTFGQIGMITLVFQMTSSLLQPLVGRVADGRPMPYALSAGMVFTLIGIILLFNSQSIRVYHGGCRCHRNGIFYIPPGSIAHCPACRRQK